MTHPVQQTEDDGSREAPQNPSVGADLLEALEAMMYAAYRHMGYSDAEIAAKGGAVAKYQLGHIPFGIEALKAGLSAIARAESSQEAAWQPIETAPKDGTMLLVGHELAVFSAWWDDHVAGWIDGTTIFDGLCKFEPTHWMPLPTPPESSQGVDASLVVQQNQEVSSDSRSPTSRRGSHIAEAGEEFIEFKEALFDLRMLRKEYEDLNGGGPNWTARNMAAWAKIDELFAAEDEAAWCRQQEDAHG